MKWEITFAIERGTEIEGDNINEACEKANREKGEGERIVAIRAKR